MLLSMLKSLSLLVAQPATAPSATDKTAAKAEYGVTPPAVMAAMPGIRYSYR